MCANIYTCTDWRASDVVVSKWDKPYTRICTRIHCTLSLFCDLLLCHCHFLSLISVGILVYVLMLFAFGFVCVLGIDSFLCWFVLVVMLYRDNWIQLPGDDSNIVLPAAAAAAAAAVVFYLCAIFKITGFTTHTRALSHSHAHQGRSMLFNLFL